MDTDKTEELPEFVYCVQCEIPSRTVEDGVCWWCRKGKPEYYYAGRKKGN